MLCPLFVVKITTYTMTNQRFVSIRLVLLVIFYKLKKGLINEIF